MGVDDGPKRAMPLRQQQQRIPETPTLSSGQADKVPSNNASSQAQLLEQARKFLDDDEIRSAPREKKVAFLESKGVQKEDIKTLLDTPRIDDSAKEAPIQSQQARAHFHYRR
jgi:hypothetical protein